MLRSCGRSPHLYLARPPQPHSINGDIHRLRHHRRLCAQANENASPCDIYFHCPPSPLLNAPPTDIVDDDRFDPYPTSSKRRAVSPSVSFLRENHTSLSPIYIPRSGSSSRGPIPVPITSSATGSVASSPISHSGTLPFASPTMRSSMGLASPITRPKRLSRRIEGEDREVDGTGEAVNGLSLA